MLRVAVVAGGCNGLTYDLYFVEEAGPEDTVVDAGAVRVAIDRASAPLLDGTVIDLPRAESFRFQNPRARHASAPSVRGWRHPGGRWRCPRA